MFGCWVVCILVGTIAKSIGGEEDYGAATCYILLHLFFCDKVFVVAVAAFGGSGS